MKLVDCYLGVNCFMRSRAWYEPLSCPSSITVYAICETMALLDATSILASPPPRTFFATAMPSSRLCLQHVFNIADSLLPTPPHLHTAFSAAFDCTYSKHTHTLITSWARPHTSDPYTYRKIEET